MDISEAKFQIAYAFGREAAIDRILDAAMKSLRENRRYSATCIPFDMVMTADGCSYEYVDYLGMPISCDRQYWNIMQIQYATGYTDMINYFYGE